MVFQALDGIWLGELDPDTGLFVNDGGKDTFVDTASSVLQAKNGPEYGLDAGGTTIFYNKTVTLPGQDPLLRVWRATPTGIGFLREPLTGFDQSRINQLPSQNSGVTTTYALYARTGIPPAAGAISWFNEAAPSFDNDITPLVPEYAGFRWVRGSTLFTSTLSVGPLAGQIIVGDAATGKTQVVTTDPGLKFDPYGWFAPEYGGALAVLAIVGGGNIAVYVDQGGPTLDLVSFLPPPQKTSMTYAQSPEPFVSGGQSFISLTLKDDPGSIYSDVTEAQIWVYGLQPGPGRFTLRCDDGNPDRIRHEAETMSGTDETYLYYNELLPDGRFELVLCRTGLAP